MAKFTYPELEGMDSILLTLELNNKWCWMDIYDSLQRRDDLDVKQVVENTDLLKVNDCGWNTLISEQYPHNLKLFISHRLEYSIKVMLNYLQVQLLFKML